MNKAIFLDRDGTINVEKDYLFRISDFEFLSWYLTPRTQYEPNLVKSLTIHMAENMILDRVKVGKPQYFGFPRNNGVNHKI